MCTTCGCSGETRAHDHASPGREGNAPEHLYVHEHGHDHGHVPPKAQAIEAAILAKNDRIAEQTRGLLTARRILALNLVSSPGSGKTTLLERTIADLHRERAIEVIEGDQATSQDADRIRRAGAAAVQINTGAGCHLDAAMVERGLRQLEPKPGTLLFIENVGNLVCPALFDLGERAKVLVASVTEGEDKPLKYPHMFRASKLVLLNKVDLLPHVAFDVDSFVRSAKRVHPGVEVLLVSALTGIGIDAWYAWVRSLDDCA